MTCPACGAGVAEAARFCPGCGSPLENASDAPTVYTPPPADTTPPVAASAVGGSSHRRPRAGYTPAAFALLAGVAALTPYGFRVTLAGRQLVGADLLD